MGIYLRMRTVLVGLALLLISLDAMAAGLEARLDRTRLAEGDTVELTLSASGDSQGAPDLSPLSADFEILSRSQGMHMQFSNGRSSTSRQWHVTLAPKHTGSLQVPALHLGQLSSAPIGLMVLPAAQAAKSGVPQEVILEVEANPENPVVQGKVIYTVRVLSRVPLRRAELREPHADDAIVQRLGDEKQYDTNRGGQNYRVTERRYAIFPQHSGELEIAPPVLKAEVPEPGKRGSSPRDRFFGGRDPFSDFDSIFGSDPFSDMDSMFARTHPIQLRGRYVKLAVQPQPKGTPSPWLPAESLSLNEAWSPDPPVFKVGEPVTRTIAITAQGVTAEQLPDLPQTAIPGINAYPDRAMSDTRPDGDTLVAQKVFKVALVPSRTGSVTLPPVELSWWNTRTHKLETARLPARTVEVQPGAAGETALPEPQPVTTQAESVAESQVPPVGSASAAGPGLLSAATVQAIAEVGYWPWVAAAFALAWMISMGLWWRARSRQRVVQVPVEAAPRMPRADPGKSLRRFEQACLTNDAAQARQALIEWGGAQWPDNPPRRLEEIAGHLPTEAATLLNELDRALYAGGSGVAWEGAETWRRLEPMLRGAGSGEASSGNDTPLPPLYPQGT